MENSFGDNNHSIILNLDVWTDDVRVLKMLILNCIYTMLFKNSYKSFHHMIEPGLKHFRSGANKLR